MSNQFADVTDRLNFISNEYKIAESEMSPVWFVVKHGELTWGPAPTQNRFRILFGNIPILETKVGARVAGFKDLPGLVNKALTIATKKLSEVTDE